MVSDRYEVKAMKILVGYDGSAPSKEALNLARKHAAAFGATVDVVTSMEEGTGKHRMPQRVWSGQNLCLPIKMFPARSIS